MANTATGVALERFGGAADAAPARRAEPTAMSRIEQHSQWAMLARLPLKLQVAVPLPGFRVSDVLALRVGATLFSAWPTSEDVPLEIGGVQLAWSEFEVVEQKLAIRLTRLA